MNRKLLSFTVAAIASISLQAAPLTPQQALAAALGSNSEVRRVAPLNDYRLVWTGDGEGVYMFATADGHCVVAAGDDTYPALLGYSDTRDAGNGIPPALEAWLRAVDSQIASGARSAVAERRVADRTDIAPLVKAAWSQDAPYNLLCPEYNGQHSLTGCMATAMAQILNYWKKPIVGTGSITYRWSSGGGELSYDFAANPFDWDNMLDEYTDAATEAQKNAVARLMLACGMASQMDYNDSFSGATDTEAALGAIAHLGIDRGIRMEYRDFYHIGEWTDMLYGELSAGRPILYCGYSTAGGHAFVCDGYRNNSGDYFHINWGWGGTSNGYYLINVLNPESVGLGATATGFNMMQSAMIGFKPAETGNPGTWAGPNVLFFGYFATGAFEYTRSANVLFGFAGGLMRMGLYNLGLQNAVGYVGVKFTPVGGGEPVYAAASSESTIEPMDVLKTYNVRGNLFPGDGEYIVTPAFRTGDIWSDIPQEVSMHSKVTCKISGDNIKFNTVNDSETIVVTDFNVVSNVIVPGEPFEISCTVQSNNCDELSLVTPVLMDEMGYILAQMPTRQVLLGNDESAMLTWNEAFEPAPKPGRYMVSLLNSKSMLYVNPVDVVVTDAEGTVEMSLSNVRINRTQVTPSKVTTVTGDDLSFSFKLGCSAGLLNGEIEVVIVNADGGDVRPLAEAKKLSIMAGDETSMSFKGAVSPLDNTATYALIVRAKSNDGKVITVGQPYQFTAPEAGIATIGADDTVGADIYYTVGGVRLAGEPVVGGMYIVRHADGSVSRVIVR